MVDLLTKYLGHNLLQRLLTILNVLALSLSRSRQLICCVSLWSRKHEWTESGEQSEMPDESSRLTTARESCLGSWPQAMLNVDTWMTGKNTKNNVNLEQKEIHNMNSKFLTRNDLGKTAHFVFDETNCRYLNDSFLDFNVRVHISDGTKFRSLLTQY